MKGDQAKFNHNQFEGSEGSTLPMQCVCVWAQLKASPQDFPSYTMSQHKVGDCVKRVRGRDGGFSAIQHIGALSL